MPQNPLPDQLLLKLSKFYTDAFSPFFLPKIAKLCFAIKSSPMAIAFAAKIKLYDHSALKKEDLLIKKVIIKLNSAKSPPSNINTVSGSDPPKTFRQLNPKSPLTPRNHPVTILHRLKTQNSQTQKPSKFKILQINELLAQKTNWEEIISTYQELYEFIRMMEERLRDLQDFVCVLKNLNLKADHFECIENEIRRLIIHAHEGIAELLPPDMFHRVFHGQPKTYKFKWLVRKGKNHLLTEEGKHDSGLNDFQLRKSAGPLQFEDGSKQKRKNYLKKSSKKLVKGKDPNINGASTIRSQFKPKAKQIRSTKPQKSFLLKSLQSNKKSKNTHEKLSQDLENEYQDKLLHLSNPYIKMKGRKRSETFISDQPIVRLKKIKSWDNIMSVEAVPKFRISIRPNNQDSQGKNIETPPLADSHNTLLSKSNRQSDELKSNRASGMLNVDSQNQFERKSQFLDSHLSISSGMGSKNNLQGIKKSNTKASDENLYDDRTAIKKRQGQRKRLRVGQMKKQVIQFSQEQSQQGSIHEVQPVLEGPSKYVKGRRKGKALPINMNAMFQRILQDEGIQKIIETNHERENQNIRNANLKKTLLKRRGQGTDTQIPGGLNSSQDWVEEYYRNINRMQRPKDGASFVDKDSCRINYSDILQLKKSLKPIASYNESKMITRYSSQKAEVESMNFQFKYKQNKLVFNHEFCLRKEDEHRKGVEEELEREKSVREENKRLDFMKEFKKCLERTDMLSQKGFEAVEKVWEDF